MVTLQARVEVYRDYPRTVRAKHGLKEMVQ